MQEMTAVDAGNDSWGFRPDDRKRVTGRIYCMMAVLDSRDDS